MASVISYGNRFHSKRYLKEQGGNMFSSLEQTAALEKRTARPGNLELFFADVIHDSHGDAVIPLRVGRLIGIV
jgi:hypothetical protein